MHRTSTNLALFGGTPRRSSALLLTAATLAAAIPFACRAHAPQPAADKPAKVKSTARPAGSFAELAKRIYRAHLDFHPTEGVQLGLHRYDGKLPDHSDASLRAEIERLERAERDLVAVAAGDLSDVERVEREVLLSSVRGELFVLERLERPWRNPMFYTSALDLVPYVARPYAPLEKRAEAVIAIAAATPAYLAQAKANLPKKIPRTWLDVALLQFSGTQQFVADDVVRAMSGLDDERKKRLKQATAGMSAALGEMVSFLEARKAQATDAFALGEKAFLEMLAATQGVRVSLAELEAIGKRDLQRNLAALKRAARAIDPKKSVREVVDRVNGDRPKIDEVFTLAAKQGRELRQMLIDKKIVSIPRDDVAEVKPTPPFMRWNSAFLSVAGPFEKKDLPSFYYISPPNPKWSAKKQREYIPARDDLLFITVHELWPGHFLDSLHIKMQRSRILKSYRTYARSEGWAHYVEEMMFEQGLGDGSPEVHVGQLLNALLRNVRFLCAIGLHAKSMTVDQATKLFHDKAYQPEAAAREQAVRGTFDPMYLSYTLGKLMIRKLRADYRAKMGDQYTLQGFHDAFLGCCGSAPIPVIRRQLLGKDSGSLL